MPISYALRVADAEVIDRLASRQAVVIEGPKACGKTETARQVTRSEALLDIDTNARRAAEIDPSLILDGDQPRLIDEWQLVPEIWNHVRRRVDAGDGQFVLTGSAVPADDATRHTGAARISRVRMRPMSLFESGLSSGAVALAAILDGNEVSAPDAGLDVAALVDEICRGGWPGLRGGTLTQSRRTVRDYLEEISRTDIHRIDGIARDPDRVRRLIRSIARNVATRAPATVLAAETADGGVSDDTARSYLGALERLMLVEDQPAWTPHLRSRVALRTSPARHFVDPSLAVAALGAGPDQLLGDLEYLGLLFESLVIRDLRVYAQPLGGRVLQYRDNKGAEVDAIVVLDDGRWAAFEVKLGTGRIDDAARSLTRFAAKVDTERAGAPAALAVITGTGFAYVREDGIRVVPIGTLGP